MTLSPPIALGLALALLLWAPSPQALAQTPTAEPSPSPSPSANTDADLLDLLKILNEETAVATRTRMNGDFVPGIVTVLHGDEMAALGARTVWDALSLVPGMEAVRDASGLPSVVVRGLQFPFNSGNVKVLIDSMPAARDNAGINSIILDVPIQLVDRIEVIRGPGSVVYGDFAYMGLIHVITKKSGAGLYVRAEEGSNISGGGFAGGRTPGGFEYSVSGSAFTGGPTDVPNRRDVDDTRAFGFGSIRYRGFSLSGDLTTREVKGSMAPGQQTHSVIEVRYGNAPSPSTHIEARLNERRNRFRSVTGDLDGDVREAGVALQWSGAPRQSWLFDVSFTQSNIDEAVFPTPQPPSAPAPSAPPRLGPTGFTVRDESLAFFSIMAQDTIEASSRVAITVGGRVDRYADVDTRVTPRASVVFRASERNIVKFQYAEGFSAPTFFELYSRGARYTNLDSQVNRTAELNYVHRRPATVFRLTAYRSRLDDLVYIVGVNAQRQSLFENSRKAQATGVEGEWEREIGPKVKAMVNVSWFVTKDSRNAENSFQESVTVPDFMGNAVLIAAPRPKTRLSVRWHYVAKRGAAILPAYSELEATLTQKSIAAKGLDLRAGVRVSTGKGVLYPQVMPGILNALSYEFPKAFVELSWSR